MGATVLSGTFKSAESGQGIYYNDDKTAQLRLLPTGQWQLSARNTTLGIYTPIALLEGWKDGDLGITLGSEPAKERWALHFNPESSIYYNINASQAPEAGVAISGGAKSDSFTGSGYSDVIVTGEGLTSYTTSPPRHIIKYSLNISFEKISRLGSLDCKSSRLEPGAAKHQLSVFMFLQPIHAKNELIKITLKKLPIDWIFNHTFINHII